MENLKKKKKETNEFELVELVIKKLPMNKNLETQASLINSTHI